MSTHKTHVRSHYKLHACCAKLILSVFDWCDAERKTGRLKIGYKVGAPVERAAAMLGLSTETLHQIRQHGAERDSPGVAEVRNREMAMSVDDMALVRPAIIRLILDRKPVRLDSILLQIKSTTPAWTWGRTTLSKAMQALGITFRLTKDWHYDRLREDEANQLRRARYLKYYFKYKEEGRIFNFFDETWFNKNMVDLYEWSDGTLDFDRGVPSGKGDRWIAMGVGSKENGWLHPLFKIWRGDSTLEDYHGNMNAELFYNLIEEYFEHAEDRSVFVLDRAPYHVELTDETRRATKSMTRPQLAAWLIEHGAEDEDGILFDEDDLLSTRQKQMPDMKRMGKGKSKIDLYNRCRALDPPPKYKVQQMFDEYNKANPERDLKMLLLAVAIPQLNPIENMWGQQKQHVRTFNKEYTMSAVKDLVLQKYNQQNATEWGKQVDKMHRFALDQWTADELLLDEEEGEVPLEDMVVDAEEEGGGGDDMDT
jgi:hypothetical protein